MAKQTFAQKLNAWYRKSARDLPWRQTKDPYKIWISEVMLQQTTVNAVIPYYEKWFKIFPSIKSLAKSPTQKILKHWQGLGYYQRARNIQKAAQMMVQDYGGRIPNQYEEIKKLPGFGPYTVGAVLSIAFNKRYPIVDANVRRVMMRILAIKGYADVSQDKKVLNFLDTVMPHKNMNVFNQALMELGALVCRNREPLCIVCPVRTSCQSYEKGLQEMIPTPKKKVIKDVKVAIALIKKDKRYLIQKRPPKGLFADLWEFPGGKLKSQETAEEAVIREVKEELGVEVKFARHRFNVQQFYTQFRALLHVYACELRSLPSVGQTRKWVRPSDFHRYPMPSGSVKIVDQLTRHGF